MRPSLTTIHVPTGETWQRAGEYLVRQSRRRADHHASRSRLFPDRPRIDGCRLRTSLKGRRNPNDSTFSLPPGFHAVVIGGAGDIGAAITQPVLRSRRDGHRDRRRTTPILRARRFKPRAGLDARDRSMSPTMRRSRPSRNRHQRVDALVNCAGILARDKEYEIETFMKVLDVNLTGTFRTCMAFRPLLARSKGRDRQHRLDECDAGAAAHSRLLRQQGRRRDADQGARACLGRGRHPRQRGGARAISRPRSTQPAAPTARIISASPTAPRSSAGDSRRTSPAPWRSSACRRRNMRPERSSPSMAAFSPDSCIDRKFNEACFLPPTTIGLPDRHCLTRSAPRRRCRAERFHRR